jgi:transcriptional repressor NrdR
VSTGNILVRKANSTLENFSSEKLEKSIFVACGKRPISQNQIRKIVQELAENWSGQAEVRSSEIGSMVMKELKQLDHIAYIRFASVYRQFKDIEEFKEEIAKLFRISEKGRSHITTDL